MLTKQQIKQRKIGGSSSSTVLGLNKYRTRYEQWQIDTGQVTPEDISDKQDIIVGNRIEGPFRKYLNMTGFNIKTKDHQIIHPDYPYISANVDGEDGDIVDELKSAISYRAKIDFGPDGSDEYPIDYKCQTNHYCLFPQYKRMRLHVIFLTPEQKNMIAELDMTESQLIKLCSLCEIRTYYDEPDILLQDQMLTEYAKYWQCVETLTPPPLLDAREVQQRYLDSLPDAKPATDEDLRNLTELKRYKELEKEAKKNIETFKDKLAVSFGEHGVLTYDGKKVASYKTQNTAGFDLEKCQTEQDLTCYYNALNMEAIRKDFPQYIKKARVLR